MAQTAVEWLANEISIKVGTNDLLDDLYKQAKAMEKEQIIKTYNNAISKMDYFIQPESAEQYYNDTYEKNL